MASQPAVSKKEYTFAYYFLYRLGANMKNAYLVTAVVAWLRAEVGYDLRYMYNKNNPLNIRQSKYASGYRQTQGNGSFAIFDTLKLGAYAAADMLKGAGKDWRRYDRIVSAATYSVTRKSGESASDFDARQQQQARDFITGIALSAWDAGRYGLPKDERTVATIDLNHVSIARIWAGIGGTLPNIKVNNETPEQERARKRGKKLKPKPPAPLPPPNTEHEWMDPWAPKSFYMQSRPKSDLGNLPG